MKFFHSIIIILILSLFVSCSSKYQKEIEQVDELAKILLVAEKKLNAVNKDSLIEITQLMKKEIKRLQEKNDTLTRNAAFKADEFVGGLKQMNQLALNYDKMNNELNLIKNQLNNLKLDLENEVIEQKDFLAYFENEKKAVTLISDKITRATNGKDSLIRKMYENHPKFIALIDNPASFKSFSEN